MDYIIIKCIQLTFLSYVTRVCYISLSFILLGRDSSVVTATRYGLDGPGIESRGATFSTPVQTGPVAHPAPCTMGTGSSPGVKAAGA
jgi:hypothetical protein